MSLNLAVNPRRECLIAHPLARRALSTVEPPTEKTGAQRPSALRTTLTGTDEPYNGRGDSRHDRAMDHVIKLTPQKPENQNCHRIYDNSTQHGKKPDLFLVWRETSFNSLFFRKAHSSKQSNHFLENPDVI